MLGHCCRNKTSAQGWSPGDDLGVRGQGGSSASHSPTAVQQASSQGFCPNRGAKSKWKVHRKVSFEGFCSRHVLRLDYSQVSRPGVTKGSQIVHPAPISQLRLGAVKELRSHHPPLTAPHHAKPDGGGSSPKNCWQTLGFVVSKPRLDQFPPASPWSSQLGACRGGLAGDTQPDQAPNKHQKNNRTTAPGLPSAFFFETICRVMH